MAYELLSQSRKLNKQGGGEWGGGGVEKLGGRVDIMQDTMGDKHSLHTMPKCWYKVFPCFWVGLIHQYFNSVS